MNLKFSNLISSMISAKANKSSLFNSTSLKPCSLNSLNIDDLIKEIDEKVREYYNLNDNKEKLEEVE